LETDSNSATPAQQQQKQQPQRTSQRVKSGELESKETALPETLWRVAARHAVAARSGSSSCRQDPMLG